jgi:excisionase family DNA binding protein
MNSDITRLYNEYLELTGNQAAAASLALAEVLREWQPGAPVPATAVPMALTVAEAAKRLHVAANTVYDLVERGELRHHRVGRAIRILPADIDAYQRQAAETARPRHPAGKYRFNL